MDPTLDDLLSKVTALASLTAALAFALLLGLYASQRRDVRRLREWMEREPTHPAADLVASELLLDRAETELEELLGEPPVEQASTAAATRVTSERPALERVTMERAALEPHPRWRTFVARVTQPRAMIAIGTAAVLIGTAAIFGSERLLSDEPERRSARAVIPSETTVAVLNGAPADEGLAGRIASVLEADEYVIGDITNAPQSSEQSVVLHAEGEKRAARRIAKALEITAVQALDRETRERAGGDADVVVIAGADRARR